MGEDPPEGSGNDKGGEKHEGGGSSPRPDVATDEELEALRALVRGSGDLTMQERTMLAVALSELEWRRRRERGGQ